MDMDDMRHRVIDFLDGKSTCFVRYSNSYAEIINNDEDFDRRVR